MVGTHGPPGASGRMTLGAAGAAGKAIDDEDGHGCEKAGSPSIEGTTCSPQSMQMMLKAGWKPGQALGRDPGAPPMTLNDAVPSKAIIPSVGNFELSFSCCFLPKL